jgi:hypothetical protein
MHYSIMADVHVALPLLRPNEVFRKFFFVLNELFVYGNNGETVRVGFGD